MEKRIDIHISQGIHQIFIKVNILWMNSSKNVLILEMLFFLKVHIVQLVFKDYLQIVNMIMLEFF